MIHPSYFELMDKINSKHDTDDTPLITSRYSIVLATSKRARQLIDGAEPKVKLAPSGKSLSTAVEEFYEGVVNIISDEDTEEKAETEEAEETETEQA